jgi:hypothetical protein
MIEWGLLEDATQVKLGVLPAVCFIAEAWKLRTPTVVKNCCEI